MCVTGSSIRNLLAAGLVAGSMAVVRAQEKPSTAAPQQITRDKKPKQYLAWSPDGKRLACSYYPVAGRIAVAVMDADGGNLQVLSTDPAEFAPSWAPDGKRLVFVHVTQSGTDGELDIHAMNADGKDRKVLVDGKSFEGFPSWSPDGRKLLFTSTRDKTQEIYVADADGKNLKRITSNPSLKQYPRWSPNGKRIAYNCDVDGNFEIYVMRADGSNPRRLTNNPAMDIAPAWSPDGKRIAFVSLRDDNYEVYVMNADGSDPQNVSRYGGYDHFPAWKPDGTLTWISDRSIQLEVFALAREGFVNRPGAGDARK